MGGRITRSSAAAVAATIKPRKLGTRNGSVVEIGGRGPVLQVAADYDLEISTADALAILKEIDQRCDPGVKVVFTGAAFMWFRCPEIPSAPRYLKTEAALDALTKVAREKTRALVQQLSSQSQREFIVGVDLYVGAEERHAGQFAVVIRPGRDHAEIVPKMLPVGAESAYLAGFGTKAARQARHVVDTALGRTLVLICHDAQCFNHLTEARTANASEKTPRARAVHAMKRQLGGSARVDYALNLIHSVARDGNLKTFRVSHKQLFDDNPAAGLVDVVGSFGFDPSADNASVRQWMQSLHRTHRSSAYAIVR